MTLIIFGIVLLAVVLGTFYLKDHFRKLWLAGWPIAKAPCALPSLP